MEPNEEGSGQTLTPARRSKAHAALAACVVSVLSIAPACGQDTSDQVPPSLGSTAPSSATSPTPTAPSAAFCEALSVVMAVGVTILHGSLLTAAFEGEDPDTDREQLAETAKRITFELDSLQTNAPEEIQDDMSTVRDAVKGSQDHLDGGDPFADALEPLQRPDTEAAIERLENYEDCE